MEKLCEYCKALNPVVVYCKADAAHLCLSCDAKIHSANALSNRHSRTLVLVCDSCRCHWASIQCSNHHMFMCRSCDQSQHNISSQHGRRLISSYVGCPSANHFAALWGFDLNDLDATTDHQHRFVSTSAVDCNKLLVQSSCPQVAGSSIEVNSVTFSNSGAESELQLSNEHIKVFYKGKQQERTSSILQQILDLKRIQLSHSSDRSSFKLHHEQTDISSIENDMTWKLENNLDQHLQHSLGLDSDNQQMGSPDQNLHADHFPLPFLQLDQLTSTSTSSCPLQGDSIWQCKIPDLSGQLWSQNMQDLGVCEEVGCSDELSMPDIDMTFQNFEELFGSEQEPFRERSMTCSSAEKDMSFDKSEMGCAKRIESFTRRCATGSKRKC